MKIVDRATFLALPAGTVYAKWSPLIIGEICIKVGNCQGFDDWVYQSLDMLDGDVPVDSLMALDEGKEVAVDMDCTERDGLYEPEQRFAVWSPEDVEALIKRLLKAFSSAHSGWLIKKNMSMADAALLDFANMAETPPWLEKVQAAIDSVRDAPGK